MKNVCFIGMGYIGLPTATLVASKGIKVLGVDINQNVVNTINEGKVHIVEPGLEELVKKVVKDGNLRASSKIETSEVYLIVVPTPFKGNKAPDISYVKAATDSVIPFLKEGDLFIIESTSPVHTTENMATKIFAARPELKGKIYIAYCPERILPGKALEELQDNDRVLGGIDPISTDKACDFYAQFVKGELHKTNSKTAEMCKLTENSSRDVQIAFANELSIICDKAGIEVRELIKFANKHPRVNILQPGCGVGGHCISVDPWFLVSQFPKESKLINKARNINDYKSDWCVEKIINECHKFKEKQGRWPIVACMGLAFKPDIDDLRESPAKYITQELLKGSNSNEVLVVEPNIKEHSVFKLTDFKEAYEKSDIVAFLVAHKEFKTLAKIEGKIILDFCGVL